MSPFTATPSHYNTRLDPPDPRSHCEPAAGGPQYLPTGGCIHKGEAIPQRFVSSPLTNGSLQNMKVEWYRAIHTPSPEWVSPHPDLRRRSFLHIAHSRDLPGLSSGIYSNRAPSVPNASTLSITPRRSSSRDV
ncbi:hypothetical protein TNCV_3790781 [Trichonephila clavipes]|nr:hypothetical protein TNCV_3790781 [Trichonephila clavipes]